MRKREVYTILGDDRTSMMVNICKEGVTSFRGNRLIFCQTDDGQSMVAKFPHESSSANHELEGYRIAAADSVRVPPVIGLVSDQRGRVGILTRQIFGKNLYEDNFVGAKYQLGTIVKQIHEIDVNNNVRCQKARVYSVCEAKVEDLSRATFSKLLKGIPIYALMELLSEKAGASIDYREAVMTHHDLHDDQVIGVDKSLFLIDFEEWRLSHPMEDISIYLYHSLRTKRPESQFTDFLRGYTQEVAIDEKDKAALNYFLLLFSVEMLAHFASFRKYEIAYAVDYLRRAVDFVEKEKIWKM